MARDARTISVSTTLDAPADAVWGAVLTPHTFVHVAAGMLRFPAAQRLTEPWRVGTEVEGWTFLFGIIPFSRHHIRVASIDRSSFTFRSEEGGGAVRTWRHEIVVEALDDHRSRYCDRLEIEAGVLTPVVVAYAGVFYRYRQRRWRRLAPVLAAAAAG